LVASISVEVEAEVPSQLVRKYVLVKMIVLNCHTV
jgi:hypothetical protein